MNWPMVVKISVVDRSPFSWPISGSLNTAGKFSIIIYIIACWNMIGSRGQEIQKASCCAVQ